MIPESTQIFLLHDLSSDEVDRVRKCHNKFLNLAGYSAEDEANLAWLSELLLKYPDSKIYENSDSSYIPLKIDGMMVVSGFVL